MTLLARVVVLAAAIAVCAWAGLRGREVHRCRQASIAAFAAGADRASGDPPAIAARLRGSCRGATDLASGAAALRTRDPAVARALAAAATRREPESATAWADALLVAQGQHRPAAALTALARLRALDPLNGLARAG